MKFLIIQLLVAQTAIGQISIDSLIVLSRQKDANSITLISRMIYEHSTVDIKKGARGYAKIGDKLNIYESKGMEKVKLLETAPRYLKTKIGSSELFFSASDYVNNSISSPLIDSIAVHFIKNSERVKLHGVDQKILKESTKLSYEFEIPVKADTTFESRTQVRLSDVDYTFLGRIGNYYKMIIPSLSDQIVYASRKAVEMKVLYLNKDVIKKFVPKNHVNFFVTDNTHFEQSPGQLISSYTSGDYSSVTYKRGNSYITTTQYKGKTTTSTYTIDY